MTTLSERLAEQHREMVRATANWCAAWFKGAPVNAYRAGRLIVKDEAHD